jgi:hypothetical protein
VDWIGLVEDRDKLRAHLKAVMKFGCHKMLGNCRVAIHLVASRVVLRSIELVS